MITFRLVWIDSIFVQLHQFSATENVQPRVTLKLFYKSYVLLMRLSLSLRGQGEEEWK